LDEDDEAVVRNPLSTVAETPSRKRKNTSPKALEKITDQKITKGREKQIKVKWIGQSRESWVTEEYMKENWPEELRSFYDCKNKKTTSTTKSPTSPIKKKSPLKKKKPNFNDSDEDFHPPSDDDCSSDDGEFHFTGSLPQHFRLALPPEYCRPITRSMTRTLGYTIQSPEKKASKEEIKNRLNSYGLKEKRKIKGDGNCQFASCADQLFNDPLRHPEVRKAATKWLRKNRDYKLPNHTTIGDYLQTEFFPCWDDNVDYFEQEGTWGDHFTLLAIAEVYKTRIIIFSSLEMDPGKDPFTMILPQQQWEKTLYVLHIHELHYSSLCFKDKNRTEL